MPANVETMMYVREKPWHGLGTMVEEAPVSADALRLAGLDWTVRKEPVFDGEGRIIPGYKANVRDSDGSVLGIVGERYKVVQNADAFSFTDDLIGGGVRYETAGSLREGRQIWLLAKMPERLIAGDEVDPYLCFTNSHDGSGGIKVCMTPIRVVCNNTLNLALGSARRIWTLRHTENVHDRLDEARSCLFRANEYMTGLAEYAERAARLRMMDEDIKDILSELFPVTEKSTERERANAERCKTEFMVCYYAPDIEKFRGAYIAVLIGGNTFKWRFIPRDDELIAMLTELEAQFWDHVQNITPPALDGSDASARFLARLYPDSVPMSQITLPDEAAEVLDLYDQASEQLETVTQRKQEAENRLKQMLGENESGISGGRIITWKSVTQERLDSRTLKSEHPALYQKYANKTSYRRFSVRATV